MKWDRLGFALLNFGFAAIPPYNWSSVPGLIIGGMFLGLFFASARDA